MPLVSSMASSVGRAIAAPTLATTPRSRVRRSSWNEFMARLTFMARCWGVKGNGNRRWPRLRRAARSTGTSPLHGRGNRRHHDVFAGCFDVTGGVAIHLSNQAGRGIGAVAKDRRERSRPIECGGIELTAGVDGKAVIGGSVAPTASKFSKPRPTGPSFRDSFDRHRCRGGSRVAGASWRWVLPPWCCAPNRRRRSRAVVE